MPQADDVAAPAREPSPIPLVKEPRTFEAVKPKSPAPIQSSTSPNMKPSGLGSGRAGLILKGASEKPTLVAKPPGPPTPVKSPWASLPPVDKVAPVVIDIPQNTQQQPGRFNHRDPHGFQGMPPPPAKEIAADDFSRSSWRDSQGNTSRTLFNSQSGGYEPVNDNRRGSRNDAQSRQPAVLQRPTQQEGPAEPSAAFQTHRATGQEVGYGRRRTSSNVSGGSGNLIRRMSRGHDMPPPHDALAARRGSLAAVSDAPSSPRNYSPSGQHSSQRGHQNQQWQSRASPVVSHPSPQSVAGQPIVPGSASADTQHQAQAQPAFEDPVEEQKKIMRQTRELAIKRRQEEEAKEEAARKERIRLKLEAMGPAPEKKKDKKDLPKDEKLAPTQIQTRGVSGTIPSPKPDVSGEVNLKGSDEGEVQNASATTGVDSKIKDRSPNLDSRPNGLHKGNASMAATTTTTTPHDNKSWQNNANSTGDRFQSWVPPSAQPASSRNVWGPPPSNEKPLGNGTFNPDLSRMPDSQNSSSHPGPIGPPNRGNAQYQQGRGRDYGSRPAPIAPPTRQQGPSREQQQRVSASGWGDLPEKLAREDAQLRQQQDAELAHKRELKAAGLLPEESQPVYKDTWRKITLNEDGTRSKVQASISNINDSSGKWKTQEENTTRPVFEERRQLDADRYDITQPHFNDSWKSSGMTASPPVRGSRFFPNSNKDIRLEESNISFERPGSPSPPPPTMAGHPVYDGDMAHPHVSLPRPSPVVKLPPAVLAPIGPPKPTSFAAAVTAPTPPSASHSASQPYFRHSAQDIRNEPSGESRNWQDRISSLLGRKSSPPKSNSLAVDSSSKHALELPSSQSFATVSLPSSVAGDLASDDGSVISKPAAEECFEEQEMGSLPVVKVPHIAPKNAWQLHPPPRVNPVKDKRLGTLAFVSRELYKFDQIYTEEKEEKDRRPAIQILLPGQTSKSLIRITSRQRSNPKRGNRNATPRSASSSHRGRGGRDASSTYSSPNLESTSISSSPNSRGGHRGGRGNGSNSTTSRGHNWSRHPAPVQG